MIKTTIAAALLAAAFGGAAHAGGYPSYTDADRAFYADADRQARDPVQAPRQQQYYQGGFGSSGAAGTARTLGY